MKPKNGNGSSSFVSEVKDGVVREMGTWLKWALAGAVVGAVLLGGLGGYFLGFEGFLWGAGAGAAVGGLGFGLFYLNANTL